MSLSKLINLYSKFENVPVRLTDVRDAIIEYGVVNDIVWLPAPFDQNILKGVFRRFEPIPKPYATDCDVVHIYYARTMSADWVRFVCCKEMMHIYDVMEARSLTQDDIKGLIEGLALPHSIDSPAQHALDAEVRAQMLALHLLAPDATLEQLRPKYISGQMSRDDIAAMLKLPSFYVEFLFSDTYKRHLDGCLGAIDGSKFKKRSVAQ